MDSAGLVVICFLVRLILLFEIQGTFKLKVISAYESLNSGYLAKKILLISQQYNVNS